MKRPNKTGPWTLSEVEKYYGKESADWIRRSITDGTIKPTSWCGRGYFVVRLKNPKCKKAFLSLNDKFTIRWDGLYPSIEIPDLLRFSDVVNVVVDSEIATAWRWKL